jgi:hypothetical protein
MHLRRELFTVVIGRCGMNQLADCGRAIVNGLALAAAVDNRGAVLRDENLPGRSQVFQPGFVERQAR